MPIWMVPKCSTDRSVIVLDPFRHSRCTTVFCFHIYILLDWVYLFVLLYLVLCLFFLTFNLSLFQSVGVAGVYILCLSQPSKQQVMAWHCTPYYFCLHLRCVCRSFVTTELVFLGRRISADAGCAGCGWVETTGWCEAHTYAVAPLQKTPREPVSFFFSKCISNYHLFKM